MAVLLCSTLICPSQFHQTMWVSLGSLGFIATGAAIKCWEFGWLVSLGLSGFHGFRGSITSGWLGGLVAGWLAGLVAGWLAGFVAGWLVGWLAGWLVGWLVRWLVGQHITSRGVNIVRVS
jgi:fructose-specific phosphotransferase system IIC component